MERVMKTQLKKNPTTAEISDEYDRIKRLVSKMPDPVDRWNALCDLTPDNTLGVTMMSKLLPWASKLKGGVKRPDLDWTKLKEMCGQIGGGE